MRAGESAGSGAGRSFTDGDMHNGLRVLGGVMVVGALAAGAWLGWLYVEGRPFPWRSPTAVGGLMPAPPAETAADMGPAEAERTEAPPADDPGPGDPPSVETGDMSEVPPANGLAGPPAAIEAQGDAASPGPAPPEPPALPHGDAPPAGLSPPQFATTDTDTAPPRDGETVEAVEPVAFDVDAVVPADHYDAAALPEGRRFGGAVTQVMVAGAVPGRLGSRPLRADDVLLVTGWAGDPAVGLRFPHVLFEVCDRVVGHAEVAAARPGLARFMHVNLGQAGFTALLPVALLPDCPEPVLRAWAVRSQAARHALAGAWPLPARPAEADAEMPRFAGRTAAPLRPGDLPERDIQRIEVRVRSAYLRKCGARACDPVGGLTAGRHRVVIADQADGWSLLLGDSQEGWIRDTLYRVVEE